MASNATAAVLVSPSRTTSITSSSNSRGSTVSYETFAPRSSAQVNRLQQMGILTAGPLGTLDSASTTTTTTTTTTSMTTTSSSLSKQQHQQQQNHFPVSTQVQRTAQHVTTAFQHSTAMRLALQSAMALTQDISHRHADLIRHSGELSAAAERLQQQDELLTAHADEIGRPLQHFNAVDRIATQLGVLFKLDTVVRGLPKIHVDDAQEFSTLLDSLDAAVDYFAQHNSLAENSGHAAYYKRAMQLQEAATALLQEAVADRIVHIAQQIRSAITKDSSSFLLVEASLVYTRFHGISSRSHSILQHIQHRPALIYQDTVQHCLQTYCTQRQSLLLRPLQLHMDALQHEHGTAAMTRLASVYFIRFCTMESSLYHDFFGSNADSMLFQQYLSTLCASSMHRTLRRSLVVELDLDTLCQMVTVLKEERTNAVTATVLAAARALTDMLADAQERLIYCANQALQKQVVRFKATPSDLNYPEKLLILKSDTTTATTTTTLEQQLEQPFESWFPPVRSVLQILSKIFRVVEPAVFEDLALTSVQATYASLQHASQYLQKRGTLHGDLFLIQHLLILREQLSPFDLELRSVERQLDFSQTAAAVRSFWRQHRHRQGLVQLLREGVSVQESSLDSKRDLEEALRRTCHAFIDHICERVAPGLVKISLSPDSSFDLSVYLPATMEQEWDYVTTQMALYLKNPGTMSILLKPIVRKLLKALHDVSERCAADDPQQAVIKALEETLLKMKGSHKKSTELSTTTTASSSEPQSAESAD